MSTTPSASSNSTSRLRWQARVYHWCFYHTANTLARWFVSAFNRIHVSGREHLPAQGAGRKAFLLICNHISHFDPPILAGQTPGKISWVVALDMYAHPAGRFFFEGIDAIPVDRQKSDRAAAKESLRRLKRGEPVGLFPEGGIRSGAESIIGGAPLDEAVGSFAQLADVPIVPCVMLGTDKLYAKEAWKWRRTTLFIRFGAPLSIAQAQGMSAADARADLTRRAEESMRALAEELRVQNNLSDNDMPMTAQERWKQEAEMLAALKSLTAKSAAS